MRLFLFLAALVASSQAFAPNPAFHRRSTALEVHRRDVLITGIMGLVAAPTLATAASLPQSGVSSSVFFKPEDVREPSQMATGGKLDVNAAPVGDYMKFPGMYPTAAGKIASNGPYTSVKDIYSIDGLTANDKKMFKKYESELTANPPGRAFDERINARVST